jgi:1,4-dihydroxy-2-naphthoate octaprenyltransferase
MYVACLGVAYLALAAIAISRPWALLALASLPVALAPARRVLGGEVGRGLVDVLVATGQLQLLFGVLLAVGIAL